ncbi:guanylin-like isoform X2 [Cynoglossus semilaevis]|nr:guanylin-like isoform X2 [Cynoglossus semilaevis]XP_024915387.1 guanylin-like isoform X2 [Cynoglossus semilaevis]
MRTITCVSLFLLVFRHLSCTVIVKEGDFQFSLDSVKALGHLLKGEHHEASTKQELHLLEDKAVALCSHPALPGEFKPLCLRKDGGASLARLILISNHPDDCEICVTVACTGCRTE